MNANAKDYRHYSCCLENSGDDLTPRPPLDASTEVDGAILGAGFTGLWTAYCLLHRDPSLDVLVVEREIAGLGASGRNGGWCGIRFATARTLVARWIGFFSPTVVTNSSASSINVPATWRTSRALS